MSKNLHVPVLLKELMTALSIKEGDVVVDCTLGGGGHTKMVLDLIGASGVVIGIDRDPEVIVGAHEKFKKHVETGRLKLVEDKFSNIGEILKGFQLRNRVNALFADLGLSSNQLGASERGFAFDSDGPLDMRMSPEKNTKTAAEILNHWDKGELARIFREFGEDPKASILASKVIERRETKPFETTKEFSEFVKKTIFYKEKSRKNPATKAFQALRIAVNDELDELVQLLDTGFQILQPGGRFGIISFHSLEDRLVKKKFVELTGEVKDIFRRLPLQENELKTRIGAKGKVLKPFPISPTKNEIEKNPRARSAKLRVIEKIC